MVIYVVAALLASAEAVVDSSSMAMVPATVDGPDLERAVGRLGSTELAMNDLVGPPLGGLLFGLAIAAPFGVDAVTFAGAALVMGFMSGSYRPTAADGRSGVGRRPSMRASLAEGIRWLWNHRLLRTLALVSTALGTASFIGNAVFVIFATDTLELSDFGYGAAARARCARRHRRLVDRSAVQAVPAPANAADRGDRVRRVDVADGVDVVADPGRGAVGGVARFGDGVERADPGVASTA